jgi:hypothetical protein
MIRQLPRELHPAVFDLAIDGSLLLSQETTTGHVINLGPEQDDIKFVGGDPTTACFAGLPSRMKTIELWLPQGAAIEIRAIRVDRGAVVEQAPSPTGRRWTHYGSSISHCVGAASPTRTWPAIVARTIGLEGTNLGLAGQCMLDQFVARAIRDLPCDVMSLKVAANVFSADAMRHRPFGPALHGFLDTIREGQPTTPILVVSPIFNPVGEDHPGPLVPNAQGRSVGIDGPRALRRGSLTLRSMRESIAAIVTRRRDLGDENLYYLDGQLLLGSADAGHLPDNLHPDDDGNALIAARFAERAFGAGGPLEVKT